MSIESLILHQPDSTFDYRFFRLEGDRNLWPCRSKLSLNSPHFLLESNSYYFFLVSSSESIHKENAVLVKRESRSKVIEQDEEIPPELSPENGPGADEIMQLEQLERGSVRIIIDSQFSILISWKGEFTFYLLKLKFWWILDTRNWIHWRNGGGNSCKFSGWNRAVYPSIFRTNCWWFIILSVPDVNYIEFSIFVNFFFILIFFFIFVLDVVFVDENGVVIEDSSHNDLRTVEFNFLDAKNICCGLCGEIVPYELLMNEHLPTHHPEVKFFRISQFFDMN